MLIENMMYFALGLLVAGLVALVILPAVWKRAVRLTKRRIEAATPITMAEFRADKDQLRAEFALSTRRLEMNVETLRKRLAEQLGDVNQKRTDLGALKAEREQHLSVVNELEEREAELRARVAQLEKESTDLAQRLRMRDRDLETRDGEIAALRQSLGAEGRPVGGAAPTGRDDAQSVPATKAQRPEDDAEDLVDAEARFASAESRLNALLAETSQAMDPSDGRPEQLLADKLSMEDELDSLRRQVGDVERSIMADWQSERVDEGHLRNRLNDIAASVSRLVYAVDDEQRSNALPEESLFDRVQRFAEDGESEDMLPTPSGAQRGSVSDRLAALREIQGR